MTPLRPFATARRLFVTALVATAALIVAGAAHAIPPSNDDVHSAAVIVALPFDTTTDATEATTEAAPTQEGPAAPPSVTPQSPAAPGATDIPEGAVRGDGTATCPPEFPIKGNTHSMIYHTAESRVYGQTIAELCFSSPEAAEAAGYRSPKNV